MARVLDGAVEVGILAVLLLSPIPFGSVLPWSQAGIEGLVVLTLAAWLARMLVSGEIRFRESPLLWPGVAMFLFIGMQLVVPGRTASRYGTWESLRLFSAYLAFLLVFSASIVTPRRIVRAVSVLVAWATILALWGLANRAFGRELVLWFEKDVYRGRLVSTFVNPNHQALYFTVALFLALGMLLRPLRSSAASAADPRTSVVAFLRGAGAPARVLFGGATIVLGVSLVLTASRGGVAGATAGLLTMSVLTLLGRARARVLTGFALSVGAFVAYAVWFGADGLQERLLGFAQEPFADIRLKIWQATVRVWTEAPLLGVGLGAFEDAVIAHRPMGLKDPYIVDYAHNDYLQLLAEGGLVGILILGWAAGMWLTFVVGRWRDRRDTFVRGLTIGGLGAVAAVAVHSVVDFGLHMPANALQLLAVLALLPIVVTLRRHQTGVHVGLRERSLPLDGRSRVLVGAMTGIVVLASVALLAPAAVADWEHRRIDRLVSETRAQGALTVAGLGAAERGLEAAARLDPWNPRIQTTLAGVAAALGDRVWAHGVTPDGRRLSPNATDDRLAASGPFFEVAYAAYQRSLEARPLVAQTHRGFGWFLSRLDDVRRAVGPERFREAVIHGPERVAGAEKSLLPEAARHLGEAVRLDPASSTERLNLVAFMVAHRTDVPLADTVIVEEARRAVQLDRRALPDVVRLLTVDTVGADLLWRAVPRESSLLLELSTILEARGMTSAASMALEDAVVMTTDPSDQATMLVAKARFMLRHGDKAGALSSARRALALQVTEPEVFVALAEVYEASGMLDEAVAALGTAIAKGRSDDPRTLNGYRGRLAALLLRRGDRAGALQLRRQAVQATPNDGQAHLEYAEILDASQELAEAIREYDTARTLAPGDWRIQRAVAGAFLRHGLFRESAGAAELAVRLNPTDDDLRVELGDAYSRIGRADRAREQYRHVLARQPAHEAASRGLRTISSLPNPG